jgi:putative NADPH-quinone reductase
MAAQKILIIEGHPDASERHLCHALADAYAEGAHESGLQLRRTVLAKLDFPLLKSQREWEHGSLPPVLAQAQVDIVWAEHLLLIFPLWLGDMPALVKGFLEQVARPGFAFSAEGNNPFGHKALKGRSARVVVTMGMPAVAYRWYFRAHSLKALERNILGFVGIAPIHETLIGMVGKPGEGDPASARRWLAKLRKHGQAGD